MKSLNLSMFFTDFAVRLTCSYDWKNRASPCSRRRRVLDLSSLRGSRTGARLRFPVAPPLLVILHRGFEHRFCGFVQPAAFSRGKVAFDFRNCARRSEMHVGRFPAHVV